MLVLSRKVGERIWIGTPAGDVWVEVLQIDRRGKVRFGIDAPADLPIAREEVKQHYDGGPAAPPARHEAASGPGDEVPRGNPAGPGDSGP